MLAHACKTCEFRRAHRLNDPRERHGEATPLADVVAYLTMHCPRQQNAEA